MATVKKCMSCGGSMKKMAKGGSTKKYAMGGSTEIVGMPKYGNNPRTQTGAMLKKGGVAKAKFGAAVNVQRGYPGKIRSAKDQGYTPVGEREPDRTKFKKGGSTDKKWIQKAINPAHKGYCTPMTKPTCTPKRKALAKTLKKIAKNK